MQCNKSGATEDCSAMQISKCYLYIADQIAMPGFEPGPQRNLTLWPGASHFTPRC